MLRGNTGKLQVLDGEKKNINFIHLKTHCQDIFLFVIFEFFPKNLVY